MTESIIIALIAFLGTGLGTGGGIVASSRLTSYRINQLEKKMDKHNNLIERMVAVEQFCKSVHHRIDGRG